MNPMRALLFAPLLASACSPVQDWKGSQERWSADQIRFEARDYWAFRGLAPLSAEVKFPKVAILEFSVQYVTDVDPGTGGVPSNSTGADFPPALRLELPEQLYATFLELAPEFERQIISREEIVAHPSYRELRGPTKAEMGVVSASARSEANRYYPAGSLKIIRDDEPSHGKSIWRLIQELKADTAIQARLAVGVNADGKAVIHHNSYFFIHTVGNTAVGVSRKALHGDQMVVTRTRVGPPVVDSALFVPAVKELSRAYLAMALVASGRER